MATGRIGTTPVLTTRWSKAPAAGTTSLSGLDDNSVSLVYSVGYEAVYQNGVLLSRGNDYTATNGTTITLTTATVAGDIIEVFANQTIPLTDTYSQTVSDGRFIKNTLTTTTGDIIYASAANTPARLGIGSTDQVLKVSGGIPVWGAVPASTVRVNYVNPSLDFTSSSASTVDITGYSITFTPTSATNKIVISYNLTGVRSTTDAPRIIVDINGTTESLRGSYINTTYENSFSGYFVMTNMAASSTTVKLRINPAGTLTTFYGASAGFKGQNLTVMEIY